ncbi:hypothetical protein WK80_23420 [Burkholderia multivorans]|nr:MULTISPECIES: hypothetical protein [Burkholderia cepacia complex]KVV21679.1 hypothetical protein WK80_23420 [Burkholderia multivorans]MDN7576824.1 hypothetical protein [Burkholderia contaminans]PRF33412.1 hypothetical protein C6Q10_25725 [Burkholderia multivorans]
MSYDDAKNYTRVIYLHEWDGKPFYWGMVNNSYFGGHKRKRGEDEITGRYANGYRHWIEGCLRHGARLYIGVLDADSVARLKDVEAYLIERFPSAMNSDKPAVRGRFDLWHSGDVPLSVLVNALHPALPRPY